MIKKRMIIMLTLMLVLILGYFGIGVYKTYVQEMKNKNSQTMLIHSFQVKNILSVEVKNNDDGFDMYRNNNNEWEIKGFESLPYQNSMISSYIEIISNVAADRIIEEDAKDLSKYGLANPVVIKYSFEDASDYIFMVGDKTPDNKSYYAKKANLPTIFLINSGRGDTFKQSYKDLFIKEFLTEIDSSKINTVKSVTFSGKERKEEIVIEQIPQNESSQTTTMFRMVTPEKYDVDADLTNTILNELTGIMRGEVIEVFPDNSLIKSSGLDNPLYTISVKYSQGISKLNVGNLNDKGQRYVMREGVNILFVVDNEKLKWVYTQKDEFTSKTPFIRDIRTINNITIKITNPFTTLDLKLDYEKQKYFCNDIEINSKTIVEFCEYMSKITSAGTISEEQMILLKDKVPDIELLYKYNNRINNDKLEIYKIDEWLYLLKINGSGRLTITNQTYKELINLIQELPKK